MKEREKKERVMLFSYELRGYVVDKRVQQVALVKDLRTEPLIGLTVPTMALSFFGGLWASSVGHSLSIAITYAIFILAVSFLLWISAYLECVGQKSYSQAVGDPYFSRLLGLLEEGSPLYNEEMAYVERAVEPSVAKKVFELKRAQEKEQALARKRALELEGRKILANTKNAA